MSTKTPITAERLEEALSRTGAAMRQASAPTSSGFGAEIVARSRARESSSREFRVLEMVPRRAWMAAGVAAGILVVAGSGFAVLRGSSVGSVEGRSGRVSVSGVAGRFNLLNDGTHVATAANSTAIIDLDDGRIRMFLSESTDVRVDGIDSVELAAGQTWVNVQPNSGFFEVATENGTVEVHGTSFGIVKQGDALKVYLASGEIRLRHGSETTTLKPDEFIELGAGSAPTVQSAEGAEPPAWTTRLYREYQITHSANFFPSSGVK